MGPRESYGGGADGKAPGTQQYYCTKALTLLQNLTLLTIPVIVHVIVHVIANLTLFSLQSDKSVAMQNHFQHLERRRQN